MATVRSISDVAVYCTLPAYGDMEVLLPTSEINVRKHRKVADYVRVGQQMPVQVIRVEPGRVDVSLKQVRAHEAAATTDQFHHDARVNLVVRTAAAQSPEKVRELYEQHIWPLEDPYALMEEIRAGGDAGALPAELVAAVMAKFPEASYTATEDVMLRFGTFHDGAARLTAALQTLAEREGIQVLVVAPPTYRLVATDKTPARAAARLAAARAAVPAVC